MISLLLEQPFRAWLRQSLDVMTDAIAEISAGRSVVYRSTTASLCPIGPRYQIARELNLTSVLYIPTPESDG